MLGMRRGRRWTRGRIEGSWLFVKLVWAEGGREEGATGSWVYFVRRCCILDICACLRSFWLCSVLILYVWMSVALMIYLQNE